MITRLRSTDFTTATISAITGPTLTSVQIASDGTYATILDDTAVNTSGGFIVINGTGFVSGCQVYIDSTISTSVTFVSSTRVNVQVPALSAGTYVIYLINPDGSMAIRINGITYSAFPAWSTGSNFGEVSPFILVSLNASSDSNITYTLAGGSSLPPGITLQSNGTLSGTFTGEVTTTYNFTIVATDVELQNTSRTFSVTIVVADPFFKDTSLLLNSITPVNTWITDASTNRFNLTVNGDSRSSKFSPYYNQWAVRFTSANTDHLALPFDSVNVGANNFTLEAWIFVVDRAAIYMIFNSQTNASTASGSSYGMSLTQTNGYLDAAWYVGGATYSITGTTSVPLNAWNHVALVRTGGTMSTYLNGVRQATRSDMSTNAINAGSATYQPYIGRNGNFYPFNGFISDFRIIIGSHPYDATSASLTVPNSRLTAVANTAILTCNSNRFVDNNTQAAAKTITVNNTPQITTFAPFTESDQNIGSGYFDGTGDYLSSSITAIGTNDFCIEYWSYLTAHSGTGGEGGYFQISATSGGLEAGYTNGIVAVRGSSGQGRVLVIQIGGQSQTTTTYVPQLNEWFHTSITRVSNTLRIFVNGVLVNTPSTVNANLTGTFLAIGGYYSTSYLMTGYIADFRVIVGTGYSSVTVPTTSLTAITNTSLLTLQNILGENNHRFIDDSKNRHVITRFGDTTQGTFTPFSQTGWSVYINGSSTIGVPAGLQTAFAGWGGRTRSWECWIYRSSDSDHTFQGAYAAVAADGRWVIYVSGSKLKFDWTTSTGSETGVTSTASVPVGWAHLAVCVDSTTAASTIIYLGINGVVQSFTGNNLSTQGSTYGWSNMFGSVAYRPGNFQGYFTSLRWSNNLRYTSNYTVPTTLTNDANTLFLLGQTTRWIDQSSNNYTITLSGSPAIVSFSRFNPTSSYSVATNGGSAFFDGTGDYLTTPSTGQFQAGGDFTIAWWYYPTVLQTTVMLANYTGNNTTDWSFETNSSGQFLVYIDGGTVRITGAAGTVMLNQWSYFVVSRSGSTITAYCNGATIGTYTLSGIFGTATKSIRIGAGSAGTNNMVGYCSGVHLAYGVALTGTIPTSPPTAVAGTQLLLNFTNGAVLDYTSKHVILAVGDSKISTVRTRFNGSSYLFDGTGDYMITPPTNSNVGHPIGGGDFTAEMWIYPTVFASFVTVWGCTTSASSTTGFHCGFNASGQMFIYYNSAFQISSSATSGTLTLNSWNHLAIVRNSGVVRIYVNGTVASSTWSTTASFTQGINIFGVAPGLTTEFFTGNIDNFRLTVGLARYTANFSTPASAFLQR